MEKVVIENLIKKFDNTVAVDQVSFKIEEGSFFTFLGPSGCGKTTILRSIAGFIKPDQGKIFLGNRDITNIQPESREVGMVFQNYALFPHMNVYENVAYGLKIKKLSKKDIKERVEKYLRLVRLNGYENRKVNELSGGEQQRVALARSLAIEPKVLLLDEPLCNLDAKLRDEMRVEIKELQRKLGITTIFVTHDQNEALTMSHKIAVFNKGKCVQIGTPKEVYTDPKNSFVASFIGDTNLFNVKRVEKNKILIGSGIELKIKEIINKGEIKYASIRPQHIILSSIRESGENEFEGIVEKIQFNGNMTEYCLGVSNEKFKVTRVNDLSDEKELNIGDRVYIRIPMDAIKLLSE